MSGRNQAWIFQPPSKNSAGAEPGDQDQSGLCSVLYYGSCNLACEQCNIIYADANAQEMTIDQIRLMADNLAAIGVCVILLIGGEPFVRKDFRRS